MLLYLFVLFIVFALHFIKNKNKYTYFGVFILLGIFLCMGYMTGSDWRAYELLYKELGSNPAYTGRVEFGYYLYMVIAQKIGLSFWTFFILTKLVILAVFFAYIEKFSGRFFYFNLAMFVALIGLYLFIDNPMRNLIGAAIYLWSFRYVEERNLLKYILVCVLASLFHYSFVLLIPLYFILNQSFNNAKIVIAYVVLNILLLVFSEQLVLLIKGLQVFSMQLYGRFQQQVAQYVLTEGLDDNPFAIGLIIRHIIFAIVILNRKKIIDSSNYGTIIFNSTILTLFLARFVYIWPIILRLTIPFSVFYCISFGLIIENSKTYKFNRLSYYIVFIVLAYGTMVNVVTGSFKYIPYTNYMSYILQDKPSYNFRDNYNFRKSPYK